IVFSVVMAWVFLPAILPLLTYFGWTVWFASHRDKKIPQRSTVIFLLACSLALLASTYPRWDTGHLLYVTPVFYVLVAALIYAALPRKVLTPMFVVLGLLLALLWRQTLLEAREFTPLRTPSGPVSVRPEDRAFVESLLRYVRPGDSLFVFPNFPTVYFLTGGVNPTRFSNLLAGFMTDEHEQEA